MVMLGISAVATIIWALTPQFVLAHERRTIANKYEVEVGWDVEPTLVNQMNAATIAVYKAGTEQPVEGVEKTLRVKIAFGGNEPKEFRLQSVWGKPGYYVAKIIPTRVGGYIFTFTGDIEGTPVNETFESGPGRFEDVASIDDLQFPPVTAANEVRLAREEASAARTIGFVGIGLGAVGIVIGGAALLSRRRG
jgi:hypothetical protein